MGGVTFIHPIAIILTLIMGIILLISPRRFAFIPFIVVASFITEQQRIVISGFDFTMLRIMILIGSIRIILKNENRSIILSPIDKCLILYTISYASIYVILRKDFQSFAYQLGFVFNTFGIYFLFRCLVKDFNTILLVIKSLMIIVIPIAIFMLYERIFQRNLFHILGGVPEITLVREGRLRCQGAFMHPLLAGAFGATLIPLFIGYYMYTQKRKLLIVASIICALTITILSASSGPILALVAIFIGYCFWPFRHKMQEILLIFIISLFGLDLAMKAPIWALIGRIGVVGGSTGYHRYILIDNAIRRFQDWWLLGVESTDYWGYGLWDVTNYYIQVAVQGGLISLILLLAMIYFCFKTLSIILKITDLNKKIKLFTWSIGVALFSHLLVFLGMTYWGGQIMTSWYLLIIIIAVLNDFLPEHSRYSDFKSIKVHIE